MLNLIIFPSWFERKGALKGFSFKDITHKLILSDDMAGFGNLTAF